MRRPVLLAVAAAALLLVASGQPARAQIEYDFKIPFDFVAGGKTFTAGQYAFVTNLEYDVLTLESKDTEGKRVMVPVETRIAEHKLLEGPELVFDEFGGKLYVSELLPPGDDGYLMHVTKAKHTHRSVKGAHKKLG